MARSQRSLGEADGNAWWIGQDITGMMGEDRGLVAMLAISAVYWKWACL